MTNQEKQGGAAVMEQPAKEPLQKDVSPQIMPVIEDYVASPKPFIVTFYSSSEAARTYNAYATARFLNSSGSPALLICGHVYSQSQLMHELILEGRYPNNFTGKTIFDRMMAYRKSPDGISLEDMMVEISGTKVILGNRSSFYESQEQLYFKSLQDGHGSRFFMDFLASLRQKSDIAIIDAPTGYSYITQNIWLQLFSDLVLAVEDQRDMFDNSSAYCNRIAGYLANNGKKTFPVIKLKNNTTKDIADIIRKMRA